MIDTASLKRCAQEWMDSLRSQQQTPHQHFLALVDQHTRDIKSLEETHRSAHAQLHTIHQSTEIGKRRLSELNTERIRLEAALGEQRAQIPDLTLSLSQRCHQLELLLQEREAKQSKWKEKAAAMETQIKIMQEKMEKHRQALGLSFERQGDQMQFAFSCLLPNDPGRLFTLTMKLDNEGRYQGYVFAVKESVPQLDCLRELEVELLKTNDLKGFMLSVRHAFMAVTDSGT